MSPGRTPLPVRELPRCSRIDVAAFAKVHQRMYTEDVTFSQVMPMSQGRVQRLDNAFWIWLFG